MEEKEMNFVSLEEACRVLGCEPAWIHYTVADDLVRTRVELAMSKPMQVSLKDLEDLDRSEFMVISPLAAARYGCVRSWIDALTRHDRPTRLRAYRQTAGGKQPTLLFKLRDIVEQMRLEPVRSRGGKARKGRREKDGA